MPNRFLLTLVLGAAAGLAAACTSTATGTPTSDDGPSATTGAPGTITTAQPGQPTVAIPPRPKELSLQGVPPCDLFTAGQVSELDLSDTPESRTSGDVYKAPQCVLRHTAAEPYYTYFVSAITSEGIGAWLDGKRTVVANLVTVAGFPAVDVYPKGTGESNGNGGCRTAVDVADGQQLMVYLQPTSMGALSQEQECQMTEQAASFAVTTLQTKR